MVLWICIAVVAVALVVLTILVIDLVGHVRRLQKTVEATRTDLAPYIPVVMSLTQIARPGIASDATAHEPAATHR